MSETDGLKNGNCSWHITYATVFRYLPAANVTYLRERCGNEKERGDENLVAVRVGLTTRSWYTERLRRSATCRCRYMAEGRCGEMCTLLHTLFVNFVLVGCLVWVGYGSFYRRRGGERVEGDGETNGDCVDRRRELGKGAVEYIYPPLLQPPTLLTG